MLARARILLLRLVPSPVVRIVEGFWATPLAMSLAGIVLAGAVQAVPEAALGLRWTGYLGHIDVDGARAALGVIAGGMVSLVAMVFSLTFVALSITAQQLSPRILDYVLRERSTQMLLGLSLATFLFAAVALSAGEVRGAWRLGLAVGPVLALAAATLVMVVVFAHRMTRVMRADEMVARLGHELVSGIHRMLRPPEGCCAGAEAPADFEGGEVACCARAGYVGMIDYGGLAELAARRELLIRLDVRENDFLLPGDAIARISGLQEGAEDPAGAVERCLNLTDRREAIDTAGYEAAALCEAALRALSPGINDPATAISCLNRLFEGLALLVEAEPAPRLLAGEDGVVRLLRPPRGAPEFIEGAVLPVVAASRRDGRVRETIVSLARRVARSASRIRDREAIDRMLAELEGAAG